MTTFQVQAGQSLTDIALQLYGSVDGVFLLLDDNPSLGSLTPILEAGQKLKIRPELVDSINRATASELRRLGAVINTGTYIPFQIISTPIPT